MLRAALNEKVKHFLLQLKEKGGVVNTVMANAVAKVLIARSNAENLIFNWPRIDNMG